MHYFRFTFQYTIIIPLLVITVFGVWSFMERSEVHEVRADLLDNLAGHGWDDYYGTNSYNSCNSLYNFPVPPPVVSGLCHLVDWGLNATFTLDGNGDVISGSIEGMVWHENLGWICTGSECLDWIADCGSAVPPEGAGNLALQFGTPDANGWAEITQGYGKICSWGDAGDAGWISYTCSNDASCGTADYRMFINTNTFVLGDPENVLGGSRDNGCTECGYAWNGYTANGGDYGTGWIQYSPSLSTIHTIHFESQDGTVYSYNPIAPKVDTDPASTGQYNATYLVLTPSGSIVNFNSEELYSVLATDEYLLSDLYFSTTTDALNRLLSETVAGTQVFENALGFLDVGHLIDIRDRNLGAVIGGSTTLDGEIYHRNGDLRTNSTVMFTTAAQAAGTIIVEGDLNIEHDIVYDTSSISNLKGLPSVSWIVLGDVNIEPEVSTVSGNFFVLGDPTSGACATLANPANDCGRFSTGATSTLPLTIHGSVMARQFYFERTYTDALNNPAELILYEGRLVANPPPGFEDAKDLLPVLTESTPF